MNLWTPLYAALMVAPFRRTLVVESMSMGHHHLSSTRKLSSVYFPQSRMGHIGRLRSPSLRNLSSTSDVDGPNFKPGNNQKHLAFQIVHS
jgi:hypothetical protein